MNTPMSTQVNQLKNVANTQAPPKIDDDPMVQDVINSLVRDVHVSEQVKSTPIATFQQSPQPSQSFQPPPQQYQQQIHQPYPPLSQRNNVYIPNKSLIDEWVNTEDAKIAACIAFVALLMLYPTDLSSIYNKFEFLTKFQQYDIFIRAGLFALILYVLLRKFKHIL